MPSRKDSRTHSETVEVSSTRLILLVVFLLVLIFLGWKIYSGSDGSDRIYVKNATTTISTIIKEIVPPTVPVLDKAAYDKKVFELANVIQPRVASTTATSTPIIRATSTQGWPVKTVYPNVGALLPFNRIVAYYGNFYSTKMGVLGEYPPDVVLTKLAGEVEKWKAADPSTPVIPAVHYIAAVAQASAGTDGDYLARMPFTEIDKAISLGKQAHGVVFLDLQLGLSTVPSEVHAIEKYLVLPEVHLGLDPEFAMKNGARPGTVIGTLDASQINEAAEILAKIVRDNNLPPKILLLHRFTDKMITNAQNIKPLPEVQIVMDMDGWGPPDLKKGTYQQVITREPVQFSGIKLFYKNDLRAPSTRMLTPGEIFKLRPMPSYIQYQ